jgi:hypothetical protein
MGLLTVGAATMMLLVPGMHLFCTTQAQTEQVRSCRVDLRAGGGTCVRRQHPARPEGRSPR